MTPSVTTLCKAGNTVNSNINNNLNALNALKADKHLSIYEFENEKVNKHISTYETENEKTETKPKNSLNPSGNCIPWHPEENGQKIPLNLLPEPIRNVINEYNKLPLPKYNGIIPSLLEKMKYLLHHYGERIVIKTIAGIANSTFQQYVSFGKKGKQQLDRFPFVADGREELRQGVCGKIQ